MGYIDLGNVHGNNWYSGDEISGGSTTATVFPLSGIAYAHVNDFYVNETENKIYKCTLEGEAEVAKWVYVTK